MAILYGRYLLGNAFRMDSGKPPEKVKQVKEAKVFFQQVTMLGKVFPRGYPQAHIRLCPSHHTM
jgi:hypothetical protein